MAGSERGDARIAIVAGEASGDALAASLIDAVRARVPGASFEGIAGPRMQAAGCVAWHPQERLAVRGYVEVLRNLPELLRIRADVRRRVLAGRFPLFVGVDAPDFNLALERSLRRRGVRTIHFVSPSIWAWRSERLARIGESVDRMLTLFPFETPMYEQAGVAATFVGHPFAAAAPVRRDPLRVRSELRLDAVRPLFALLPGSRVSELELHAELFLRTASLLAQRFGSARFLVPLVNRETREIFDAARYRLGLEALPITTMFGHAPRALEAADAALVASGTATLEAMLYQCPHVITYRLHPLTARMVRRRLGSRFVGLPNVIAGRFVVPEILQDDATPENLAQAVGNLYADVDLRMRLEDLFAALSQRLRADTPALIREAVAGELAKAGLAC
jgi:lipid-A-disaccharide synthase